MKVRLDTIAPDITEEVGRFVAVHNKVLVTISLLSDLSQHCFDTITSLSGHQLSRMYSSILYQDSDYASRDGCCERRACFELCRSRILIHTEWPGRLNPFTKRTEIIAVLPLRRVEFGWIPERVRGMYAYKFVVLGGIGSRTVPAVVGRSGKKSDTFGMGTFDDLMKLVMTLTLVGWESERHGDYVNLPMFDGIFDSLVHGQYHRLAESEAAYLGNLGWTRYILIIRCNSNNEYVGIWGDLMEHICHMRTVSEDISIITGIFT